MNGLILHARLKVKPCVISDTRNARQGRKRKRNALPTPINERLKVRAGLNGLARGLVEGRGKNLWTTN
jgi:hypothetical protein